MSTPQQQEALLVALGPHDIKLCWEPRLPANALAASRELSGKIVCGQWSYCRLAAAFAAVELLCKAVGEIKR